MGSDLIELADCHFCGCSWVVINHPANGSALSVKCKGCNASGPLWAGITEEQAAKAWNETQAADEITALRATIAKLEAGLQEIVAREPRPENGDGERCHRCAHCAYRWPDGLAERHGPSCAYVIARALLSNREPQS